MRQLRNGWKISQNGKKRKMKCKKCGSEMEEIFQISGGFGRGYACRKCEPKLFKVLDEHRSCGSRKNKKMTGKAGRVYRLTNKGYRIGEATKRFLEEIKKIENEEEFVYVCEKCLRVSRTGGYEHATEPKKNDFCDGKWIKKRIW